MDAIQPSLPPERAWDPLPAGEWDEAAARHLLLRATFSATPGQVDAVTRAGPALAIAAFFQQPEPMPMPERMEAMRTDLRARIRSRGRISPEERQNLKREFQDQARAAYNDFAVRWFMHASNLERSAMEKVVLFLQNIFVVAAAKVKNPLLLYQHQQLLRLGGLGSYQTLCKAVSRSPAMVRYLDLQQNQRGKPNENFARELFELFTLGEGNYTESDVKEAARAFTGYRQAGGRFVFSSKDHDNGNKIVFGERGKWDGDEVIDLIFRQDAARRFLPIELCRFYLTDLRLPREYYDTLGDSWSSDGYHSGRLLARFFRSRLFFESAFRGSMIKSPTQLYLGLLQDLELDPQPFPRFTQSLMRQMGQPFFNPPNVRGWVGGRHWINSATLAARRQLVMSAFTEIDEDRLNADELIEIASMATEREPVFTVSQDAFRQMADETPVESITSLVSDFLASPLPDETFGQLTEDLAGNQGSTAQSQRIRAVARSLLLSPYYQLC
jgi:uncharacterized protein (DUF1800 family)